ncbi:MAG TPA: heparinase II/III family protein, partial [Sandaracinaceae bacterium LLY-WYZ-13_1]|nr:heparinase II/III family protein [Sandaracinaceae bacterium LLY-WYZ-13_1]
EPRRLLLSTHPTLLVTPDDRDVILARVERDPYDHVLAELRAQAAEELRTPDPEKWDHSAYGHNGCIAQANAMLAWLFDDDEAARRAHDVLLALEPDVETNDTWDLNIRMPDPMICHTNAWDLLQATGHLSEDEAAAVGEVLTTIIDRFFEEYVLDRGMRQITLGFSQNNHPIRTAAAVGHVAMAFPEHPRSDRWLDWAVSELDYLLGEDGQYIQPDGGVSEGPFYHGFGTEAAILFLHAYSNVGLSSHEHRRDCVNRRDVEPWAGHGCVDGERFTFDGVLERPRFQAALDWSIGIRLPSGQRPPLADARLYTPAHGALLTGYGAPPHFLWDWLTNTEEPRRMDDPLVPYYLIAMDDAAAPEEPPYRNRFQVDAGNAVFRSGWDPDARWLLLMAEHGAQRRTLHDHVDGTSFSVAAYGDYLLSDTGYYKPNGLDNARTADAPSHNVILIDGRGAPDKGLLNDWGDEEAYLEHPLDGDALAWAEARQRYEDTEIVRGVAFVRRRYFVVADRLSTTRTDSREHRFRLHAHAGRDLGHTFALEDAGLHVAREHGGVRVHTASTVGPVAWEQPPFVEWEAPYVHEYEGGREEHHGVADAVVEAVAPGFLSVVAPYRVGATDGPDAPLEVTAVDAGADAVAWLVSDGAFADLVWLRGAGASGELTLGDGAVVASDAAVVVVALDGSMALAARGTEVAVDGAAVFSEDASDGVGAVTP